jgi:hypothetical protein
MTDVFFGLAKGDLQIKPIPVILRSVDWMEASFARLQALPSEAKAVTSWPNIDEAFTDVARGIRRAIEARTASTTTTSG